MYWYNRVTSAIVDFCRNIYVTFSLSWHAGGAKRVMLVTAIVLDIILIACVMNLAASCNSAPATLPVQENPAEIIPDDALQSNDEAVLLLT